VETLGILIIEGRGGIARALLSSRTDLRITHAERMAKALALAAPARAAGGFAALLVDLSLPDCQGLEAYRRAASLLPGTPIVALQRGSDADLAEAVIAEGAQACLEHDGLDGGALALALRQAVLRRRAEDARFRSFFDAAPIGILLAAGRRVLMANAAAQEMLGYGEADFGSVSVLAPFPPAARPILEAALDAAPEAIPEARFSADLTRKDLGPVRCRVHVAAATCNSAPAVAFYLVPVEVADGSAAPLGDPARQARKMEALERLSANVAHDFNNLLTAINGYSEHLLTLPGVEGQVANGLKAIKRSGETAASLVRGLMALGRPEGAEPRPIAVDAAVREMIPMLEGLAGPGIAFAAEPGAGDARIALEPGQLEQVLVSLCANARDAMPGGGRLTVRTEAVANGAGESYTHLAAGPGPALALIVEDTGSGMGPETLESLFEPFYSTKRGGRGAGLGLSAVYGIVARAGGGIAVASAPGGGSCFRIVFPRTEAEAPGSAAAEAVRAGAAPAAGGETVLVVEDEPSLREMLVTILDRFGFAVRDAANADDALAIVSEDPSAIDLIVTDVMLRGEGGHEMAASLQAVKPGARILFVSGYSRDSLAERGILVPEDAFLEKPFTPAQLAAQVRALLDAARKAG
jgi:signal transduction histidine kinase/ActR/RegA family two-component response regulator